MKRLILTGLIITVGSSFAGPMPPQPHAPVQPSSLPQAMPPQPTSQSQSLPTAQSPAPPQINPMPPVEIKPEDKAIIDLKKKMSMKQTYNEYQKVDKATSIDRINLERSLREAKYSLKAQIYKEKQLDSQLPYPYYYNIPITGVVGNIALTSQTPLKDGTVLRGKDRISIKDGLVYVGDYLISYPAMDNIKQPKVDVNASSSSAPRLLTGLSTNSSSGMNSSAGSPPMPLPLPLPSSK